MGANLGPGTDREAVVEEFVDRGRVGGFARMREDVPRGFWWMHRDAVRTSAP
ncbi:hypothetical protein PZ938_06915 [Luteipulveratus sp. YIM 133132]|uniref:hypothetical protein n=1 Tax=Luteipulveratus flavus TaxID=3031728 RepID=UPI0023AF50CE|nr:hypothetical protein [Luteipulveratus sp. YIM 133132]MDE9365334.1 hypothetical protein [Luteipulveratus sp. YIM 133132]